MRRVTTTVATSCVQIQKVHASSAAALAYKQPEPTPERWVRPRPQATGKWARPESFQSDGSPRTALQRNPSSSGSNGVSSTPNTNNSRRPMGYNRSETPERFRLDKAPHFSLRREPSSSGNNSPSASASDYRRPTGYSRSEPSERSQSYTSSQPHRSRTPNASERRAPETLRPISRAPMPLGGRPIRTREVALDLLTEADFGETDGRGMRDRDRQRKSKKLPAENRNKISGAPAHQEQTSELKLKKKPPIKSAKPIQIAKDVYIPSAISVDNLAKLLKVKPDKLDDVMHDLGLGSAEYGRVLKSDDASLVAMELRYNPIVDDVAAFDLYPEPTPSDRSKLPVRPPIVTIMGHVDHGKTTLLDTLRSASVAAGESGGITQHIGAFSVPLASLSVAASSDASKSVTFLDTPGHAAFSAMRARGANMTDIIVLVVAADDGVMPQTKEVINLALKDSANVHLIVAINKCDKPGVDVSKIKHAVLAEGVQLEEFGGDVPCVEVSGLTGLGLDNLMETIITLAEVSDLRAETDLRAHGHVVEARMDKGRGPIATVLVSRGTLRKGDPIAAGVTWAKVRQMTDDKGNIIDSAPPGTPVTVAGWKELPVAGDEVLAASGRKAPDDVKRAVTNRMRERNAAALLDDLESINAKRKTDRDRRNEVIANSEPLRYNKTGEVISGKKVEASTTSAYAQTANTAGPKELRILVKADVSGTVEAVLGAISHIGNKDATVNIIHSGVGNITDSDVDMAAASDGMILGFNISVPRAIESLAAQSNVPVHVDSVIYRLIEDITKRVTDLLPKIIEKKVVGEAKVQQLFSIQRKKEQVAVAGCRVVNGTLEKHKTVRIVRGGKTVGEGKVTELRHLKSEVNEVRKGMECGLMFDNFDSFVEGDLIQAYDIIEISPSL